MGTRFPFTNQFFQYKTGFLHEKWCFNKIILFNFFFFLLFTMFSEFVFSHVLYILEHSSHRLHIKQRERDIYAHWVYETWVSISVQHNPRYNIVYTYQQLSHTHTRPNSDGPSIYATPHTWIVYYVLTLQTTHFRRWTLVSRVLDTEVVAYRFANCAACNLFGSSNLNTQKYRIFSRVWLVSYALCLLNV